MLLMHCVLKHLKTLKKFLKKCFHFAFLFEILRIHLQDGLRGLNLGFLIPGLVIPTVAALGLALALPYIFAHSLVPLVLSDPALLVNYSTFFSCPALSNLVTTNQTKSHFSTFKKIDFLDKRTHCKRFSAKMAKQRQ